MSAFSSKKKEQEKQSQILSESPEEILRRKRDLESRVGDSRSVMSEGVSLTEDISPAAIPTGLAAEKAVGALCYLPKSIHRLASRAAEDRDLTAKRFFFETIVNSLHQQGIITDEQHDEALRLPNEFGWKGRKAVQQ
jgi:hypothetical protein